jgi:uncharacterized phage protein gp47/JayE
MTKTAFARPTLKELRERAIAEINAKIPGADANLRNSVLSVIVSILAGMTTELYGYIDFLAAQVFVDTAEAEYLDGLGAVWGVHRKLAAFATGEITATSSVDAVIPVGTRYRRKDQAGTAYITTESAVLLASAPVGVRVKAEKVGSAGNTDGGQKLSLLSPIAGVTADAVITAVGLTGGADRERDELYRERIIYRIQEPPRGGSKSDYERWALEVPGVTRAWCYPLETGAGTVGVRFMMDDTYPDGIPQQADLDAVHAYITDEDRKPVTAQLAVSAPIPQAVDITISELSPNTPEARAAIESELKYLFYRTAYPGSTVYVSQIWEAIAVAGGIGHFKLLSPTVDDTMPTGVIPVLGVITYAV